MKWLLLFLLSFSLRAEIPSSLIGPSNVKTILFKEMKTYMFQVIRKSQIYQLNDNCRLYKFFNQGQHHSRRSLKFCLITKFGEGLVEQNLQVQVTGNFGGSFRFIQQGTDIQAVTLDQFINFQFPSTKKGMKTEFYFDYFTFGLVIDRRQFPEILDMSMQIRSFQLNMYEDRENGSHFRNYLLTCEDCDGVSWLRVQNDGENTRYYDGNQVGEVTPAHFNKMLGFFIIRPFNQLGTQLKNQLIEELRWPRI